MKKADSFNIENWLTENKVTRFSLIKENESLLNNLSFKWNQNEEGDEPYSIFDEINNLYNNLTPDEKIELKKDLLIFTNSLK